MNMLRDFLACRNNEERFEMFNKTFAFQWSESEMQALYRILNLGEVDETMTAREKYQVVYDTLKERKAA